MKPSHLTTPRTLAECTFECGYAVHRFDDRPSLGEFITQAAIGLMCIGGLLAFVLGVFA